jgi:bilirubin oxidase
MTRRLLSIAIFAACALNAKAQNPQLTSWLQSDSTKYARIYQSTANETAGTKSTTWSRGTGTQTNPVYAGVSEVNHSANWVYIRTSGLAGHVMGPWYLDAAKTQNFPNFPSNTAVVYRIPRTPAIPTTKTLTGLGATGRMVNGVSMFDSRDAFSYVNASATDATPTNGLTGDGIWNRDGYHNEGVTFDPALAHQAGNNYHYHAQPIGLRYQLGDHVDYNATTNRYTESTAPVTQHSPILAWAADGLPVYGPYGYSDPTNASSGVRRMISGFALRDGTNGTTAITVRQILPLWAQRVQNRTTLAANQYGPAVNATYLLGHYIEDFDYRGDLGQTQTTGATVQNFDLNEQNVRFCVTPEFPSGTWAYFTPINADGTPQYPYTTGRQYYGSPTGGASTAAVMNADTPLTQHFLGGPSKAITINTPVVSSPNVTLTWSSIEGGTYSVDASSSSTFTTFTNKATGLAGTGTTNSNTYAMLASSGTEYGRVNRTALATYDTNGFTAATVAQTATTSYQASGTPNTAPTISSISAQSTTQNTATGAIAFTIGDAETAAASLTLSGTSSNTTLVPNASITFGGSGANRTVTVTPATNQTGTSTITITVSDGALTASSAFTLTVTSTAPTISNIAISPASPTNTDTVTVSATITPSSGRTISSATLTYNNGSTTPTTVFSETFAAAALANWTTANNTAQNPWTITFAGPPQSPFNLTTASNHTAVGQGNQTGVELIANAPQIANATMTTTNNINATGTSGTVTFWTASSGLTGTQGWDFQTSTDGTTWTTRLSELTGSNHAYQQSSYTLTAGERVSTLKLRFRFAGPGANQTPRVYLDDVAVTIGATSTPVNVAMTNTGGNTWSASIPAQTTGTTVTYTITGTDNTSAATTSSSQSYTVTAGAPVLALTPAGNLTSSGSFGGPFSPSSINYTLSNSGNASMPWTATKTAAWLTISPASGTLAAGASTTVTASINASANSLSSGVFTDTITFTNTSNGTGNTTRGASLTVNFNSVPAAPVLTALSTYSQGKTKTVSWAAAAGATSYTVEIASAANFASVLTSQTVTGTSATFSNLASGTTYYYRVLATNNIGSSAYSNVVSSTQDNVSPTVAITSPASATSTATATLTVSGTAADALSGISAVTVNGVSATTLNSFATWSVTIPLGFGTNGVTAVAFDGAGNVTTTSPVNVTLTTAQTNNPLIVPEVMTGTTFNLNLHPTTKQFFTGAATNTYAYNNMLFWGPTLIMNKGDWVQLNVTNNLAADTTTTHWHGFHIPAIMDGGPHQTIPAGTTWSPSFKVDNNAGLYWFHPHLHEKTQEHMSYGAGGMIIIRDPVESALNLPRTYGVDDIPLCLTSRRFTNNQIVATGIAYGDFMLTNGVLSAQTTLPRQYVRLRLLNAEIERAYNLGFSDNRTFYQICTDGGLVNAPIALTRIVLGVGERAEILVDLSGDTVGATFDLQAFNSGQANDFPGGEPNTTGPVGSLLNNTTFTVLKINVGAQTANPVLSRPATLTTNTFYTVGQVTNTRNLTLTGGGGGNPFSFDNLVYSPSVVNHSLNLNAIEQWNLTNTSAFTHSFHIHDVQFKIISRTGGNNAGVKTYEDGWKDVLYISRNQTVSFIAKFDHFASNTNPFMYHCHFGGHEDGGMMGQFVVVNNATEDLSVASFTRYGSNSLIQLDFKATPGTTYTLQWSPDLSNWQDIGSVTSDGNSASFTETDETRLAGVRGFYRVKIPTITSP